MRQIWHQGVLGLDFTTLSEADALRVLEMRNDACVARFMYASHITKEAHFSFIESLRGSSASIYWLFKKDRFCLGVGSLSRISIAHKHAYIGIYANPFLSADDKQSIYELVKNERVRNAADSKKASQKISIGALILDALESYARDSLSLHALYLEVIDTNAHARRFYERHGYVMSGVLKDFIQQHLQHTPARDMAESSALESHILDSRALDVDKAKSTAPESSLQNSAPRFCDVCVYGKILTNDKSAQDSSASTTQTAQTASTTQTPKSTPRISQADFDTNAMPSIAPARQSLIIAELSANHNQSLNLAKRSIRAARLAGADFVKLQTYTPECLTIDSHKPYFRIDSGTLWDGQTLYDLYKQAYTPFEWHAELFAYARAVGVGLFSSPFSPKALELLEQLECPMYKIASFEITDTPFIELVASTKKPIIISTGIATHAQIMDALEACDKAGNSDVTLLLCTSSYPAPLELANIASMQSLARYGTKFGLSDHTQGDICAVLASVLGASMIEKHFIIKRSLGGVDSAFSMEAREFAQMVQRIKDAHTALGSAEPSKDEAVRASQARFARSLFVCEDIVKGEILDAKNIRAIRPNDGLPPKLLPEILGKRATHDLKRGEPLRNGDFE